MAEIQYLTKSDLIEINKYAVRLVGGTNFGVQSESALDVVVNQPQQVIFGNELYPTIWLKAAFIMQKITKKHVFVDGNKRTAIQAAMFFLHINGHNPKKILDINNADSFVLSVTNSKDDEDTMVDVANWFKVMFE